MSISFINVLFPLLIILSFVPTRSNIAESSTTARSHAWDEKLPREKISLSEKSCLFSFFHVRFSHYREKKVLQQCVFVLRWRLLKRIFRLATDVLDFNPHELNFFIVAEALKECIKLECFWENFSWMKFRIFLIKFI